MRAIIKEQSKTITRLTEQLRASQGAQDRLVEAVSRQEKTLASLASKIERGEIIERQPHSNHTLQKQEANKDRGGGGRQRPSAMAVSGKRLGPRPDGTGGRSQAPPGPPARVAEPGRTRPAPDLPVEPVPAEASPPSPTPTPVPEDSGQPGSRLRSIPVIVSDVSPPQRSPTGAGRLTRRNGRQVQRNSLSEDTTVSSSSLLPSSSPDGPAVEATSARLGPVVGAVGNGGDGDGRGGGSGQPTTLPPTEPPSLPPTALLLEEGSKAGVRHIVDGRESADRQRSSAEALMGHEEAHKTVGADHDREDTSASVQALDANQRVAQSRPGASAGKSMETASSEASQSAPEEDVFLLDGTRSPSSNLSRRRTSTSPASGAFPRARPAVDGV